MDLVYSFEFTNLQLNPTVSYWTGWQWVRSYGCDLTETPLNVHMLTKVTLPNLQTWQFTYNLDSHPGPYGNLTTAQMTSLTMPPGATVDYTYGTSIDTLAKYIAIIEVDPIGGGAFTTTYGYTLTSGAVSSATETRADGSKHIVDFNPATSSFPFLRESETWTDKNGSTQLIESATGWLSGDYGTSVSSVQTTDLVSGSATKTTTEKDGYGRVVTVKLWEQRANPLLWSIHSVTHNRRNTDVLTNWRSRILQVDQVDMYNETSERVVGATQYAYDEFALTDRGTVLQQASGYGPGNNNRGNLTSSHPETPDF